MGAGLANVFPNVVAGNSTICTAQSPFFRGLTSRFSRISFREFSRKLYRHHQTHQIFSPPPPFSPIAPVAFAFLSVGWGWNKVCVKCSGRAPLMTCKFERVVTPNGFVVLHISGRIDSADVEILRELIEKEERAKSFLAIDLTEVTLIGRDAIRLLSTVETKGTELRNCPAYIRNWVSRDKCSGTETD
jgi:hypothetical protein